MIPFEALLPIALGWAIAVSSPGPAVLAIAAAAMGGGRANGLAVAIGVWNGSVIWACIAALGFGASMAAHPWIFEALRILGAGYLLYLAAKSLRSAINAQGTEIVPKSESLRSSWARGFTIHVMNPKAALLWGALFAVVIPQGADALAVVQVGGTCLSISFLAMSFMALLFSTRVVATKYLRMQRLFDGAFAGLFGYAAVKVLLARLN